MTAALDAVLTEAMAGGNPDSVLLMRLLAEAATEAEARDTLARATRTADPAGQLRLERLRSLWADHPQAWALVRAVLADAAHDARGAPPDEALRSWAAVFDRLAAASPEAGVALYSLGSPTLLADATREIVDLMDRLGLLDATRDALDLGCGIGRLVIALAPRIKSVLGIDISPGMIAEAQRRSAGLANIRLLRANGRDLDILPDASIDIVLAADVFPYLVQIADGLPQRHLDEFRRVLRPGGAALILNYSYRANLEADRAEIGELAAASGLSVERSGDKDLLLWDAPTFLLRKAASINS